MATRWSSTCRSGPVDERALGGGQAIGIAHQPRELAIAIRGERIPLGALATLAPRGALLDAAHATGSLAVRRDATRVLLEVDGTVDGVSLDHGVIAATPVPLAGAVHASIAVSPEAIVVPRAAIELGAAHWTASALPLIVVTPIFGLMLAMAPMPLGLTAATLLAGTPALTMIGAIGAALTVSLRRGGLLMAVLVLPLTIPVLIFGVAASNAALAGPVPFGTPFTVLVALTLGSVVLGPFAAAAALRHGLD